MAADYDVVVVGGAVANLFAAGQLARAGCRVALLDAGQSESALDLGVLWPGLSEHWGVLAEALGESACEAFVHLLRRSVELLEPYLEARGAVLQLAATAPEWSELTLKLAWTSRVSPRRLMSGGAASNYLPVDEAEGAAFVPGCGVLAPAAVRRALLEELSVLGGCIHGDAPVQAVGEGWAGFGSERVSGEVMLVGAGHQTLALAGVERPWLFPQRGVALRYTGVLEPWNAALAGVEAYRGHLMLRGSENNGWLLGGINPGAGWEAHTADQSVDLRLAQVVHGLAARLLPSLRELPFEARPLIYTWTADGLPLAGPLPGSQRCWVVAGFGTRSWSLGPAVGEQVARALLGESATELEALPALRPSRSFAVPPRRYGSTS